MRKGQTRNIKRFQWLPKTLAGKLRWLQFVTVRQKYNREFLKHDNNMNPIYYEYWKDQYFI